MTLTTSQLPDVCDVAFKEWAGVCAALLRGRQNLILRKGGIAEGPSGFRPDYPVFWLFPTRTHQAAQGLRPEFAGSVAPEAPGNVAIQGLAVATRIVRIDQWEGLERLSDLHVWTEETVRQRFNYRSPGLWLIGVRIYETKTPWIIQPTAEQEGCKTWVELNMGLPTAGLVPVLGDLEAEKADEELVTRLGLN